MDVVKVFYPPLDSKAIVGDRSDVIADRPNFKHNIFI